MDQEDRKREVKADTMAMKYIFADVDGTLGIGGIGIPEKNRLAIRKYVEEGGSFGVCTGRSPDSVKGFIGDLPINTLSVVNGGCALYDFQKGEYLDEHLRGKKSAAVCIFYEKRVRAVHRVQNRHCESYELLAGEDKRGSDCLPAAK